MNKLRIVSFRLIDVPILYDRRFTRDACHVGIVGYVSGTNLAYVRVGRWMDGWVGEYVGRWLAGWDSVHDGVGIIT